jgi:hypothetical protein
MSLKGDKLDLIALCNIQIAFIQGVFLYMLDSGFLQFCKRA